jgi:hypothetical protein
MGLLNLNYVRIESSHDFSLGYDFLSILYIYIYIYTLYKRKRLWTLPFGGYVPFSDTPMSRFCEMISILSTRNDSFFSVP